jgi:hypothetical protein
MKHVTLTESEIQRLSNTGRITCLRGLGRLKDVFWEGQFLPQNLPIQELVSTGKVQCGHWAVSREYLEMCSQWGEVGELCFVQEPFCIKPAGTVRKAPLQEIFPEAWHLIYKGEDEKLLVTHPWLMADVHKLYRRFSSNQLDLSAVKVSSIHMPRWASRFTVRLVKAELLAVSDLTRKHARLYGFEDSLADPANPDSVTRTAFGHMCNHINEYYEASAQCVWGLQFELVQRGIKAVLTKFEPKEFDHD